MHRQPKVPSGWTAARTAGALLVVLAAGPAAAGPPGSLPLDWPLGGHDGAQYLPGHGVRVMQNYANPNPRFGNRRHSAVDLALDAGSAANATVYAAADGVVTCTSTGLDYPGRVVVVEHTLSSGGAVYTQYGHLNGGLYVVPGQVVSRGTPLGTLVYQTLNGVDNSHLHFEVRTFANWAPGNCWGPGYADYPLDPSQQGWLNPVVEYFGRRPSFPGAVSAPQALNFRSAASRSAPILGQIPAGQRIPAHAAVTAGADRWYRVWYNSAWVYVAAYWNEGWGGDLYFTELRRDPDPAGVADMVGASGLLHVVARHADGRTLYGRRDSAGGWSGWGSLEGFASSEPVLAVNWDGRLEVFVRGADDALWHRWQTASGGGWAGWQSLDGAGSVTSAPAVARNLDGRLQVFVRWSDGTLRTRSQVSRGDSAWTGWSSLGGILHSGPAAGVNHDGRLDVFVLGMSNDLFHVAQTTANGGFGNWAGLGGAATSGPTVARNGDGRLEVFLRGGTHDLRHVAQTSAGGSWGGWLSRGGVLTSPPAVAANGDGRLEAFVRGNDGRLRNVWQTSPGGGWSGWGDLEGYLTASPVADRQGTRIQVVVRGTERKLFHRGQTAGGWSAYAPLGSPFAPY